MRQSFGQRNYESSIAKIKRRDHDDDSNAGTSKPKKKLKTQGNPIPVPTNNNLTRSHEIIKGRNLIPPSASRIARMNTSQESNRFRERKIPVVASSSNKSAERKIPPVVASSSSSPIKKHQSNIPPVISNPKPIVPEIKTTPKPIVPEIKTTPKPIVPEIKTTPKPIVSETKFTPKPKKANDIIEIDSDGEEPAKTQQNESNEEEPIKTQKVIVKIASLSEEAKDTKETPKPTTLKSEVSKSTAVKSEPFKSNVVKSEPYKSSSLKVESSKPTNAKPTITTTNVVKPEVDTTKRVPPPKGMLNPEAALDYVNRLAAKNNIKQPQGNIPNQSPDLTTLIQLPHSTPKAPRSLHSSESSITKAPQPSNYARSIATSKESRMSTESFKKQLAELTSTPKVSMTQGSKAENSQKDFGVPVKRRMIKRDPEDDEDDDEEEEVLKEPAQKVRKSNDQTFTANRYIQPDLTSKLKVDGKFGDINMQESLDSVVSKTTTTGFRSYFSSLFSKGNPTQPAEPRVTAESYQEFMLKSRTNGSNVDILGKEKTVSERVEELTREYTIESLTRNLKAEISTQAASPVELPPDPIDNYQIEPSGRDYHYLTYPFEAKKSVTVYERDFDRLNEETFLNDTLIDVFPKIWADEFPEASIYTFSSFFYTKLAGPTINYDTVKRWTAQEDIFKKKYLVIPVAQNSHWFIILVVNPGHCIQGVKGREYHNSVIIDDDDDGDDMGTTKKLDPNKPYIITLDPLNLNKNSVAKDIVSYLKKEAISKLNIDESHFLEPEIIMSECPKQKNFTDCGVFCLHYMRSLYKYPETMMTLLYNNTRNDEAWDRDRTLRGFRTHLRRMLKREMKKYREYLMSKIDQM